MSTTRPSEPHLRERYGHDTAWRRRRVLIAVSGVVGLVALAWVAWAAWTQVTPQVQSSLRSFHAVDDHAISADVAVKPRSSSVTASCLVRAYNDDHSVVGQRSFRVTGASGTVVRRVQVRTDRPSTSVELVGCTAPGQKQPR